MYFLGGKGGRCVRLTTLTPSCAVVMKSGNLNFLEPCGPLQACNGTALPLPCIIIGGCNKRHCYSIILITLAVFSVCMDRGFGLVCYVRRLDKYVLMATAGFWFSVRVEYSVHIYGLVHVFGNIIGPPNGQVHKLLMCSFVSPVSFSVVLRWVCIFLLLVAF